MTISDELSQILPYLSEGFCIRCKELLESRIQNLNLEKDGDEVSLSAGHSSNTSQDFCSADSFFWPPDKKSSTSSGESQSQSINSSPASVTSARNPIGGKPVLTNEFSKLSMNGSNGKVSGEGGNAEDHKRMSQVGRKKDFVGFEYINGKQINVLQGLELHTRVFNEEEQKKIVEHVYGLQRMGQSGKFRERTYSEPRKWMRGKGRVTIQFGCCYNYAMDKNGNPPGIIRDEEVDPIPALFKSMIKRMIKWHVLPPTCIPNSCIVNIYDEGDCIPPHIDHHDFVRPFCTVSFLTESNILFGSSLKVVAPGEFSGSAAIPLPAGSVLILKGNGADIAKHCVPAVPGKRISITFRKMDDSKLPYKFLSDPDLQGIQPLGSPQGNKLQVPHLQTLQNHSQTSYFDSKAVVKPRSNPTQFGEMDFPPLGAPVNKWRAKR